jgi:hypothetical protein
MPAVQAPTAITVPAAHAAVFRVMLLTVLPLMRNAMLAGRALAEVDYSK